MQYREIVAASVGVLFVALLFAGVFMLGAMSHIKFEIGTVQITMMTGEGADKINAAARGMPNVTSKGIQIN